MNLLSQLGEKLLEHIYLSFSATLMAIVISIPLGIWMARQPRVRGGVLGVTNIFQTIPSLALLAFLIPFLGIGIKPTIVALTIYALLPITRNTYTGLMGVPADNIDAARSLGFTLWQRLWMIEIPLALPVIIAGIRTATATTIGITTIAAFIGAGGLGDFITQGLATNSTKLILLGAIPTAILALLVDYIIAQFECFVQRRERIRMRFKRTKFIMLIILFIGLFALIYHDVVETIGYKRSDTVVVGSKNFTEQIILADLIAELIETKTNLHVVKKLNLGTTSILQKAILKGDVDIYPEYTGTAYMVVLRHKRIRRAKQTYEIVKREYQQRYQLTWLEPFGFNNTQAIAVRDAFAKRHGLETLSQLAPLSPKLVIATPAEFFKRPDGYPGLKRVYGLHFKRVAQMQPDLMYSAIKNKAADAIMAFSTDGRIEAFHLKTLRDNKHFFPPYYAAPVARDETLQAHPEIQTILQSLAGKINERTMRRMNAEVDIKHRDPAAVAHELVKRLELLR